GGWASPAAAEETRRAERLRHVADAGRGCGKRQVGALGAMRDAARLDDMAKQVEVDEIEMHVLILRSPRRQITHNADCARVIMILLRMPRSTKPRALVRRPLQASHCRGS